MNGRDRGCDRSSQQGDRVFWRGDQMRGMSDRFWLRVRSLFSNKSDCVPPDIIEVGGDRQSRKLQIKVMKIRVSEQGALIPIELLSGVEELEIQQQGDRIVLLPIFKTDPILDLGSNPITCNVSDASENHDQYLYQSL